MGIQMRQLGKILEINNWRDTERATENSDHQTPSISVKTSEDHSTGCFSDLNGWIKLLPEEYKDICFDTLTELKPKIIEVGKAWAESKPLKSLYIHGDWGSGKTSFAFAALRYLKGLKTIPHHFWPRYFTGDELDRRLLRAFKHEDGDENEIKEISNQDLLFIDDLDKVTATERFKNQIFGIINRRKINNLPTIITCNLHPTELPAILDGSVVSRICDESRWNILTFPKGDLRSRKLNKKGIQF